MSEQTFHVTGMDCVSCAATVEKGVSRLAGVTAARADFPSATLVIEGQVTPAALKERLEALGYGLQEAESEDETVPESGGVAGFARYLMGEAETRFALAGGGLLLVGALLAVLGFPLSAGVFIAATLVAGYPIFKSGLRTLVINRDFNMNLLMTIAAGGALVIGETAEAATLVFLFAIGEALEGYTVSRARASIAGLMTLAPAQALRLTATGEEIVPIEALAVGDRLLIKAGERIPMDGIVTEGESEVDQSPITGESIPVAKGDGAEVFAGTINGAGMLQIRVTRLAADNTLQRIIRMVEDAQSVRAPSQRLVDRFARVYTPAIVALAVVIAAVPPLLFGAPFLNTTGETGWLYRALALLVIACPCALVISAPVTVISAITAAARRGVLIKGGAHLEALGGVKAFAFDKTGTLTRGQPRVQSNRAADCATGQPCDQCDDVLALASAVEVRGAHPLARAVVEAARERQLDSRYAPAQAVETLTGLGIRGQVEGRTVTLGSHTLFDARYPHSETLCEQVRQAEAQGHTTMLLADGDSVRGFIALADEPRPESAAALAELRALGLSLTMLTGDNPAVARLIGERVGVSDVRAGLLPADKVAAVEGLNAGGGGVAMVGDGINDTPALAAATVGIAMGGAGSPQALETADIALMADSLTQLPYAVRLSRFARAVIRQNIAASFAVKAAFLMLAVLGLTSLWMAILADVGVLLLVTLNGMRPRGFV